MVLGVVAEVVQLVIRLWNYLPWMFGLLFWLAGAHREAVISVGIGVFLLGPPGNVTLSQGALAIKIPASLVILFIGLLDPFKWLETTQQILSPFGILYT